MNKIRRKNLQFLLTPLREGRLYRGFGIDATLIDRFLLTPLREGRRDGGKAKGEPAYISTHAPAGGATQSASCACVICAISTHAPAGGATEYHLKNCTALIAISTHAPAGGATTSSRRHGRSSVFLLTPLREGRLHRCRLRAKAVRFLLTPLREGRQSPSSMTYHVPSYFYSRPCGRGDIRTV